MRLEPIASTRCLSCPGATIAITFATFGASAGTSAFSDAFIFSMALRSSVVLIV